MPRSGVPGDVLFSLTNGAYNDGTRLITLRIEDESTGRFVINVDMTGEQLAAILGNAVTRVSGATFNLD